MRTNIAGHCPDPKKIVSELVEKRASTASSGWAISRVSRLENRQKRKQPHFHVFHQQSALDNLLRNQMQDHSGVGRDPQMLRIRASYDQRSGVGLVIDVHFGPIGPVGAR